MSFIFDDKLPLSYQVKEMLTTFVLEALDAQPVNVYEFASLHFRNRLNDRQLSISMMNVNELNTLLRSDATSVDNIEEVLNNRKKSERRNAVAAEKFDPGSIDRKQLPVGSDKSRYEKELLRALISKVPILKNLSDEDMEEVIHKMMRLDVSKNDIIVNEGDEEEFLFIIESGSFDVLATNQIGEATLINSFHDQGSFGELALMYSAKEKGTVRAMSGGVLWCLDRFTFKRIVVENAHLTREKSIEFLSKISLLESLSDEERMKIADNIEMKVFEADTVICEQGQVGDYIYFIDSGKVVVILESENELKEVATLEDGGYFGELSLMTNRPRAATVKTIRKTKVGMLNRECFERLLGPCLDVLQRNALNYDSNMKQYFSDMK